MNINHIISTRGIEGNHWIHDYYFDSCLLFAMDFDLRANKWCSNEFNKTPSNEGALLIFRLFVLTQQGPRYFHDLEKEATRNT